MTEFRLWDGQSLRYDISGLVCVDGKVVEVVNGDTVYSLTGREDNLEQFTGKLDKNGKKIFIGDIVKYSAHLLGDFYHEEECIEVVDWDRAELSLSWRLSCTGFQDGPDWCEVIGNIHENPELVEARSEDN